MENNDDQWKSVHDFQTPPHIFIFHPKQAFHKQSPRHGEHKFLWTLLACCSRSCHAMTPFLFAKHWTCSRHRWNPMWMRMRSQQRHFATGPQSAVTSEKLTVALGKFGRIILVLELEWKWVCHQDMSANKYRIWIQNRLLLEIQPILDSRLVLVLVDGLQTLLFLQFKMII